MTPTFRTPWFVFVALAAALMVPSGVAAQSAPAGPTPVPRFTGPLPVTATSYPYGAANTLLEPMDLAAIGYVEEEYLVSGTANVYDWARTGDLTVRHARAPYTTRILVRRPSDAARFSGHVIVEIMHNPFGQDFSLMWGWTHQGLIERRDAYVAISEFPSGIAALKRFDPVRYGRLSFANPDPNEACGPLPMNQGRPLFNVNNDNSMEEGLRWDAISQVGALLKSTVPNRPLAALTVERLLMTAQDNTVITYITAIHRHARLASGQPVYDGYVVKGYTRPYRIRRCAPALEAGDPRIIIRNVGVPVIHLQMEGDFPNVLETRRDDSDAPGDPFRLYEIPGTAHFDSAPYRRGFPSVKDMSNGGYDSPIRTLPPDLLAHTFVTPFPEPGVAKCIPEVTTEQPQLGWVMDTAFAHLSDWVRRGVAPPTYPRLEIEGLGTPQAKVKLDHYGNGVGGFRTPYVDVPYATYHMHHDGTAPLCRQFGWEERFDWTTMQAIHGSYKNFASKVEQSVAKAVQEGRLTASAGEQVKQDMLSVVPARPNRVGPGLEAYRR